MKKKNKMGTILTTVIVSILLVSSIAVAVVVGEYINPTMDLDCVGKVVDTDLSDGNGMFLYKSHNLKDPDGIVRDSGTMIELNSNTASISANFETDKAGTWTLYGEIDYIEFAGGTLVGSGICDSETLTEDVDPSPVCGNNIVEGTEECDDGNTANNDGCSGLCILEYCGDGIVQSSEECDSTPDCESDCTLTPPPSGTSFILHQDVPNEAFINKDSYVRNIAPTSNFGSMTSTYIEVAYSGGRLRRTYQQLDLTAITSNPSYSGSVQLAELKLATDGHDENPLIGVYRFDSAWDEMTINWNNQPCNIDFSNCVSNNKVVPSQVKTTLPNGDHIWTIDITSLVNEALSDGKTVLDLAYKFEDETIVSPTALQIFSKEQNDNCGNYKGTWLENWFCRTTQTLEVII